MESTTQMILYFYNELQVPNQVGEFSMNDIFEKPDEKRQEHFFDMIKNSH